MNAAETEEKIQVAKADLAFWEKRLMERNLHAVDLVQAAKAHLRLFGISGCAENLMTADSLFQMSSERVGHKDPDLLHTLAQTAITRHRFSSASRYVAQASLFAGDPYTDRLIAFDADMELGHYGPAAKELQSISSKNTFDYLLRKAKFEDHQGNLHAAIRLMEEATEKVKHKKSLFCWAQSHLGDLYGHAGRISEAYDSYLAVLETDPAYMYAWKGIAWIAFSHDKNTTDAKRILHYILSQTEMPDLYLALAEIAAWEGDNVQCHIYEEKFLGIVTKPVYGDMYNKYLIELYTGPFLDLARAQELAEKETKSRSTPETWSWLAWVLFHQGKTKDAWTMMNNHVIDRSAEPEIQFKVALVMMGNGKIEEGKALLQRCLESAFELGPVRAQLIRAQLDNLKE